MIHLTAVGAMRVVDVVHAIECIKIVCENQARHCNHRFAGGCDKGLADIADEFLATLDLRLPTITDARALPVCKIIRIARDDICAHVKAARERPSYDRWIIATDKCTDALTKIRETDAVNDWRAAEWPADGGFVQPE